MADSIQEQEGLANLANVSKVTKERERHSLWLDVVGSQVLSHHTRSCRQTIDLRCTTDWAGSGHNGRQSLGRAAHTRFSMRQSYRAPMSI